MDIIFFLAGIVLLFKKKVKVSKTQELNGKPVKILGVLYLLPFTTGFFLGIILGPGRVNRIDFAFPVSLLMLIIVIAITVYFIIKKKVPVNQPVLPANKN
jgi:hypothetical protein